LLQKNERRSFEVDDDNRKFLDMMFLYFSKSTDFETKYSGRLHKGLYVYGVNGVGKSLFFEVLENLYRRFLHKSLAVKTHNVLTIVDSYRKYLSNSNLAQNDKTPFQFYATSTVHFEDLGKDHRINHWGNKVDVMDELLCIRYLEFRKRRMNTYISSNLTIEGLKKRYSPELYDRFFEMYNFIELPGKTRRK
jgi:hypothetical protein|tara:strand:- start:781 stop:1356 length:576 start_codon:yes stop_codon:yes gene_type:complete